VQTERLVSWTATCLLSLTAVSTPSAAEIVKRVSIEGIYDNNTFKSFDNRADIFTQTSLYLARRDTSAKSGLDCFYSGDIDLFVRTGQRHFTTHHVGVTYVRLLGEAGHLLSAGWNAGGRWDRTPFNYYDNVDVSLLAALKLGLPGFSSLRTSYRLTRRKYLHLDASSYRENLITLTYNTPLSDRTALGADVTYGHKGYTMERLPAPEAFQSGSPHKDQIALGLRLSRSLSPSAGVNVQYLLRLNPSPAGRYQPGLGTGYAEDDDLFDDRYDYEGHEISGGASQLLPLGAKLTVEAAYLIKNYRGKPALDLDGLPLGRDRRDRRRSLSAGVEMPLGVSMELDLWYAYGTNVSNDPFYAYRGNHAFSIGLSREF
jgi:hypothetical protein